MISWLVNILWFSDKERVSLGVLVNRNRQFVSSGMNAGNRFCARWWLPRRMTCWILVCVLAGSILSSGCKGKGGSDVQQRSVSELVKLYQEGGGADDFAGPALESRGEEARVQLIRMLDDPSITEEDASTIIQILLIHFPVQ